MIIVDTNVISETLRPRCNEAVIEWLDAQAVETLYITSINAAELWAGVAVLPNGARKRKIESSLDDVLARLFGARTLDFDFRAARRYGDLVQRMAAAGTPLPLADGLIASIALANHFVVATRDIAPFHAAGVQVVDPWAFRGK